MAAFLIGITIGLVLGGLAGIVFVAMAIAAADADARIQRTAQPGTNYFEDDE